MRILKNFVVLEGGDGSGTTTQMERLKSAFAARPGLPPLHATFEPTGGPTGRLIRSGLKGETPLQNETLAYLFAADRHEHVFGAGGIEERCSNQGELVVCDRYLFSSLVYQGITCGEELPERLNSGFPLPELLLFLDVDPETAQKRVESRPQFKEIYETLAFQIRVRDRYKALVPRFKAEGCRVETIDASRPAEEVAARVWSALEKMPIFKR